jgi:2-iminobutanoate/2-iminopropanoate deaminase
MGVTLIRREIIESDVAPAAIGPYSQAVRHGSLLFCSGVLPITDFGQVIDREPAAQVDHCLRSLAGLAEAAGSSLAHALRITVYTTALDRFDEINSCYATWFEADPPARVTIGVAALPRWADIELDAVIAVPG